MENIKPFTEFDLNPALVQSLETMGFVKASPIQEMTIDPILEGKDIAAQAETGSGKTGAFAIPIIEQMFRDGVLEQESNSEVRYVVLSPTRELAQQTHKVFNTIGAQLGVRAVCLIGGENIDRQKEQLKGMPQVLIATPGRLCDLIKQKSVSLAKCRGTVFDEADRLFDMGFKDEVEFILRKIPEERQLIMVSATTNMDVLNTAYKFRSHPLEFKVNKDGLLVEKINHSIAMISGHEKMPLLTKVLRDHENAYALIFCNTQFQTHLVAEWLIKMGFKAKPISGRLAQNKRTRLMEEFRSKKVTILVCTDVAARGLDIKDVNLVVNYDMPQEAANYVHRIGRTGRAGATGEAISFCAHEDCEFLDAIYKLIDGTIPKLKLTDEDFAKDICKKPYIDAKTLATVERSSERPQRKVERTRKMSEAKREERPERRERTERKPRRERTERTERPRDRKKIVAEPLGRSFEIESWNKREADNKAHQYFDAILDKSLIQAEVINAGRRKFILFGPRLTNYKYTVKPIYKKLLLPFLITLMKKSKLNIHARVSFDGECVRVFLSGNDERKLTRNGGELITAIEHVTRLYLLRKIMMPEHIRLSIKCRESRNRDEDLIRLVGRMKKKVIETQQPVTLRPLNAAERRLVHQHLSSDDMVTTTSIGEGRLKQIEISLNTVQ